MFLGGLPFLFFTRFIALAYPLLILRSKLTYSSRFCVLIYFWCSTNIWFVLPISLALTLIPPNIVYTIFSGILSYFSSTLFMVHVSAAYVITGLIYSSVYVYFPHSCVCFVCEIYSILCHYYFFSSELRKNLILLQNCCICSK